MLNAPRKHQPHDGQAECSDGQKRHCADRVKPAAGQAQKSRSRQLRKRCHEPCKQASHRAKYRRQPEIPHARAKCSQADRCRHGYLHEPVPQKGKPRQKRYHRVNAAKKPCQNHPPPTKLLAAKPRAAHKKSRVDGRVQKKQSLPAKLHPLLSFPVVMDKV